MSDFLSQFNPEEAALLQRVLVRSVTDAEFRQQLINDPVSAVTDETGVIPPSDTVVRFTEKPEGVDELVVLPDFIGENAELTEDELEAVAGGAALEDSCWNTCNGTNCGHTAGNT